MTIYRSAASALLLATLAACAPGDHAPSFASKPYESFNRDDAVAIALREWRLFAQPVVDEPPGDRTLPLPAEKPERQAGLWQRVGEYWWIGLAADAPEVAWTGKHDGKGAVFPAAVDGSYAWSAAFVSYVMRIAGAGERFPYAPNHASYVNAAASGRSPILRAEPPESYPPKRGDLICLGRKRAAALRFSDLPTSYSWPGHCAIVVAVEPGMLSVVGGNVEDAVSMTHVPLTPSGTLANPDHTVVDGRYPWFVVLELLYDAEREPAGDD
ncbi:MAG: DUF2272 domain-containing protein [Alphaproteobacteria bacterium]